MLCFEYFRFIKKKNNISINPKIFKKTKFKLQKLGTFIKLFQINSGQKFEVRKCLSEPFFSALLA